MASKAVWRGSGPKESGAITVDFPKFFTNEPLSNLLRGVNPWVIFAVICLVGILDDLLYGGLSGNWYSRPGVVGVFDVNNIPALIMSLIVEPGVWAFFVRFPPGLYDLFKSIRDKEIPQTGQEIVQERLNLLVRVGLSWLIWFGLLLAALAMAWYSMAIIREYYPTPWFSLGWHYWLSFLRIASAWYVTGYSVIWSLFALYTLNRIFSSIKIRVNPYDGDNAGGLRSVGSFILGVSSLVLIIAPFMLAETLSAMRLGRGILGQFNLWMEIILLPLLFAFMVFLPLVACRRAMFAAKDDFLNPLRDRILSHVKKTYLPGPISKPELEEITALIDYQTKLRRDFPTWPFDISMTQQIGISFVLALLPFVFNVLQQAFGR